MARPGYVSLEEAATQLKVARGTLYYYIRTLNLEAKKFPLDRKAYLAQADFEKIKTLKEQAAGGDEGEAA